MDAKLFLILFAVCICGSYKNQRNLPAPFQGNLAIALDSFKTSSDYARPYYMEEYEYIGGLLQRDIADHNEGNIATNASI